MYNVAMTTANYIMYHELASWFHLLTTPEEYQEEAEFLTLWCKEWIPDARTILELGSGGGNLASHLKRNYQMTLVDLSPEMIRLSQTINPECRHIQGDMRSIRLDELFDIVLAEDGIMYMITLEDLHSAMTIAYTHCRPGGSAFFAPDWTSEEFASGVSHGGFDGQDGRSLRYLEWTHEPVHNPHQYEVDYAYLTRDPDGQLSSYVETHVQGIFSTEQWLEAIKSAGFLPGYRLDPEKRKIFYGRRPESN